MGNEVWTREQDVDTAPAPGLPLHSASPQGQPDCSPSTLASLLDLDLAPLKLMPKSVPLLWTLPASTLAWLLAHPCPRQAPRAHLDVQLLIPPKLGHHFLKVTPWKLLLSKAPLLPWPLTLFQTRPLQSTLTSTQTRAPTQSLYHELIALGFSATKAPPSFPDHSFLSFCHPLQSPAWLGPAHLITLSPH